MKLDTSVYAPAVFGSPLAQGRGLKLMFNVGKAGGILQSPLAQGRGLKLVMGITVSIGNESPLAQGRGLKPVSGND